MSINGSKPFAGWRASALSFVSSECTAEVRTPRRRKLSTTLSASTLSLTADSMERCAQRLSHHRQHVSLLFTPTYRPFPVTYSHPWSAGPMAHTAPGGGVGRYARPAVPLARGTCR
eukprot:3623898-Prymnesium_polylepis.1